MDTPSLSFPSARWGEVRLVALGALVRRKGSALDYRIEGVFELMDPPEFIQALRIKRIVVALPAGGLPIYTIGSTWRGGRATKRAQPKEAEVMLSCDEDA